MASPTTDTMDSMTLQVFSVSLTERLKYSLNNQKAGIVHMGEKNKLPAPVARTIRDWG